MTDSLEELLAPDASDQGALRRSALAAAFTCCLYPYRFCCTECGDQHCEMPKDAECWKAVKRRHPEEPDPRINRVVCGKCGVTANGRVGLRTDGHGTGAWCDKVTCRTAALNWASQAHAGCRPITWEDMAPVNNLVSLPGMQLLRLAEELAGSDDD